MGIRLLNKYLRENANQSIKITHLSELSGKKIAIDISIYLYKFLAEDALIENIYLMITIFRYYNIIPIFIFDGKPPAEKNELIKQRIQYKNEAKDEYNVLKTKLEIESTMNDNEKQELINQMDDLKKKFVFVKKNDIENVKLLMEAYGVSFYEAKGEADELCAILSIKEKVWACLSEDMDFFVYGCPRIIRYFSLLNHTVVLYDLNSILRELNLTQKQLREICVLSGTDYNIEMNKDEKNQLNLYKVIKIFSKYKKENLNIEFYDWLLTQDINQDISLLKTIYNKFDINKLINNYNYENIKIINSPIQKLKIKEILKADGFYFP
jgi:flap endonuclease-1